ncbi:dynein light chain 4, axonemal [Paragonimus westermani]|uniref:Dynein axonemal light chain 4 n=1 Tax=Paragonimus westermani TaxID=34504 RepID=A0A5J4NAF2_9TREM|nr:dynein light chain 4, axonemal [Paragonimus westermani]
MQEDMKTEVMELCVTACEKFPSDNEAAARLVKETLDKKFGSPWHVAIGEGYGFELTYEINNLLYMLYGGNLAIIVWNNHMGQKNAAITILAVMDGAFRQPLATIREILMIAIDMPPHWVLSLARPTFCPDKLAYGSLSEPSPISCTSDVTVVDCSTRTTDRVMILAFL